MLGRHALTDGRGVMLLAGAVVVDESEDPGLAQRPTEACGALAGAANARAGDCENFGLVAAGGGRKRAQREQQRTQRAVAAPIQQVVGHLGVHRIEGRALAGSAAHAVAASGRHVGDAGEEGAAVLVERATPHA